MTLVGLLQAVAALTVFFSLITAIGKSHRHVELFSHFRLQYLLVSVLLFIAFALLRDPLYTAILAGTMLFNASFILPWWLGGTAPEDGARIKLLHANVLSSNSDHASVVDLIRSENPDVVFLQEVTSEWVDSMKVLATEYPYSYIEPRSGNFGIAMYSKVAPDSAHHVDSPPLDYPTVVATIRVGVKPLTLISSHPSIPLGRFLYESRNTQMASLRDLVAQASGDVVLLGDFNSSTWDPQLRALEIRTGLRNARKGFGILPSWPTYMPFAMIPIDHALVSDGIAVLNVTTGRRIGSDHLPLIVTLSL